MASAWLAAAVARHRPRAIAALTRALGDVDLAEEAFADACLKAVTAWADDGAPRDPLAWLLTAARNSGRDRLRKTGRQRRLVAFAAEGEEMTTDPLPDPGELRDDVLRLLFMCCHPALSRQDQIALALRIVGGLTVDEIARAFLVKPKTMEQRLTRARRTAKANPVPFETPSPPERAARLSEVSLMVYLMFNEGWSSSAGDRQIRLTLCEEAIRLARLLIDLFPGMGEQAALLSLQLFQHARRDARVGADGGLVALDAQDRGLWNRADIAEATALLQKAERTGHSGAYRIQAAIAFEHARARRAEDTDWPAIEALYGALHAIRPSPVIRLNQIAAIAHTRGPAAALGLLAPLAEPLAGYRWFHTMRAGLLAETGDGDGACAAYRAALRLGVTDPERRVIEEKIAAFKKSAGSSRV